MLFFESFNLLPIKALVILILSNPVWASFSVTTIDGQKLLLYEHSSALVVGNSAYKHFIRLPGAEQDAKSQQMLSRHVLYMFDSCFSGTLLNFRSQTKAAKVSQRVQYPVRQFITAGDANEEVPDTSYFKQVFLDLIEGRVEEPFKDGYITGEELGFYLSSKVPYYFDSQHPRFGKT